ncbi:MAG: hypothetical protein FWD26_08420 [Treponema sp.]|nr:hypothetical protein [Treponema sp.]
MELDVWIKFDGKEMENWKGGDWAKDVVGGIMAMSRSPFFPSGHDAFSKVGNLIYSGKYKTRRIDALTESVYVPKLEIKTLIVGLKSKYLDHINQELDELLFLVETLDDDKMYELVRQEY